MIEESYVSFDTAKMLKEAGFNETCRDSYDNVGGFRWFKIRGSISKGWIPCPTQALAARWLREVHRYAVCVWYSAEHEKWFYAHGDLDNMIFNEEYSISDFIYDSYEQALEAGLQLALGLIKTNREE